MIDASAIKRGFVIRIDGQLMQVVDSSMTKPGKGPAYLVTKLKNIEAGGVVDRRFRTSEKVDVVYLDRKEFQYLYKDADNYVFMDMETYEQHFFGDDVVGDAKYYLTENVTITIRFCGGKPISLEAPASVNLKIVETQAPLKGATVTNQNKPATLETGLVIQVPPFIETGEIVSVDTREAKYLGRAGK